MTDINRYDLIRQNLTDEQIDLMEHMLAVIFSVYERPEVEKHFGTDEQTEMWNLLKEINKTKEVKTAPTGATGVTWKELLSGEGGWVENDYGDWEDTPESDVMMEEDED